MAGQGATTRAIAATLNESGWTVAFVCVPNSMHRGVVPISTVNGSARQRYPDVLAVDSTFTRLIEVENALTQSVIDDIVLRFQEQKEALENRTYWETWRLHVEVTREIRMPPMFHPICELVIASDDLQLKSSMVERLAASDIWTGRLADFEAKLVS